MDTIDRKFYPRNGYQGIRHFVQHGRVKENQHGVFHRTGIIINAN